jgi:hypothetical protein
LYTPAEEEPEAADDEDDDEDADAVKAPRAPQPTPQHAVLVDSARPPVPHAPRRAQMRLDARRALCALR